MICMSNVFQRYPVESSYNLHLADARYAYDSMRSPKQFPEEFIDMGI